MKQLLIDSGFVYSGDCQKCFGRAETWMKTINGKTAVMTVKKDFTNGTLSYKSSTTKVYAMNALTIFQKQGIVDVEVSK